MAGGADGAVLGERHERRRQPGVGGEPAQGQFQQRVAVGRGERVRVAKSHLPLPEPPLALHRLDGDAGVLERARRTVEELVVRVTVLDRVVAARQRGRREPAIVGRAQVVVAAPVEVELGSVAASAS